MFLWHLIFALVVALVIFAIFGLALRRTGAWPAACFIFILFLFSWAGGIWLAPFGPVLSGVYWFPFLVVAIFVAVMLAAAVPPERPRPAVSTSPEREAVETGTALGVFFWFLVGLLIIAIAVYYI
jgi:hypothetical protein